MASHRELLRSMRDSRGITVTRAIELATEELSADNAALKAEIARMRPVFKAAMRWSVDRPADRKGCRCIACKLAIACARAARNGEEG